MGSIEVSFPASVSLIIKKSTYGKQGIIKLYLSEFSLTKSIEVLIAISFAFLTVITLVIEYEKPLESVIV